MKNLTYICSKIVFIAQYKLHPAKKFLLIVKVRKLQWNDLGQNQLQDDSSNSTNALYHFIALYATIFRFIGHKSVF